MDDKTLINHKLRFSDFIEFGEVSRIIIPINYTLPKTTYPSIYINNHDYVKHFIMVEYPHFDAKRTNIFIVKNHLKYHSIKKHLLSPLNYQETFKSLYIFNLLLLIIYYFLFYLQNNLIKKKFLSKKVHVK